MISGQSSMQRRYWKCLTRYGVTWFYRMPRQRSTVFQTKSLPDPCLQLYIITKEGRLLDRHARDIQPDGYILFYSTGIGTKSSPEGKWREYRAHFSKGQLVDIVYVDEKAVAGECYGLASCIWYGAEPPARISVGPRDEV